MRSETRNRSDKPAGMRVGESQGEKPNRNNGSLCMGKPCSIKIYGSATQIKTYISNTNGSRVAQFGRACVLIIFFYCVII